MFVYRLARLQYINDLSGEGARLFGGRWNLPGTPCLYVSQNAALCLLEFVVQFSRTALPKDVAMAKIEIPDDVKIKTLSEDDLPLKWNKPMVNSVTQKFGEELFKDTSVGGFKIPSVVSPFEFNLIFNPLYSNYSKIKVVSADSFQIDERIKSEN